MRKWREIHFLHFLIMSFFLPLTISDIKHCLILSQNVKYGTCRECHIKLIIRVLRKLDQGEGALGMSDPSGPLQLALNLNSVFSNRLQMMMKRS